VRVRRSGSSPSALRSPLTRRPFGAAIKFRSSQSLVPRSTGHAFICPSLLQRPAPWAQRTPGTLRGYPPRRIVPLVASSSSSNRAPNPRLQRTRSAPLRSPLSFKILGLARQHRGTWLVWGALLPIAVCTVLIGCSLISGSSRSKALAGAPTVLFEERVAGEVPATFGSFGDRWFSVYVYFSPSGRRVAYTAPEGDRRFYVIDGQRQPAFDSVGPLVFSADETTVAYVAQVGKGWAVIVGFTPGPTVDEVWPMLDGRVGDGRSFFSPRCGEAAYRAVRNGKTFVVRGGREGPSFDDVSLPVFSQNCASVAYTAEQGEHRFVVVDSEPSPSFSEVSKPVFRSDGTVVYAARDGERAFVVEGTHRGPSFDEIGELVASADGKVIAFSARQGSEWFALKEQERSLPYERVSGLRFDPFGHFYFVAARGAGEFFVVNGRPLLAFNLVYDLAVSPDGRSAAFGALVNGKNVVVTESGRGEPFDHIDGIVLSPNGRRSAYVVRSGAKAFIVTDQLKGPLWDWASTPLFSPDGRTVAYIAGLKGKSCVVVGAFVGPLRDDVQNLTFSSDGKKVAYGVRDGYRLRWSVTDVPRQ
jgi:hypothetical protein